MIKFFMFFTLAAIFHYVYTDDEAMKDETSARNNYAEIIPYTAQILYKGKFSCGGCIRAENWILTAAHCFDYHNNIFYTEVLTGTSFRGGLDGQRHRVKEIIIHYNYVKSDTDAPNDIALVRLEQPMQFNNVQRSIKIAPLGFKFNRYVKISAFGVDKLADDSAKKSARVKSTRIPIIDLNDCQNYYGGGITGNMFCAGLNETYYTCHGDSGSPAVDDYGRLVGILSRGKDCEFEKAPGIFTKVPNYYTWIDEKTHLTSLYV